MHIQTFSGMNKPNKNGRIYLDMEGTFKGTRFFEHRHTGPSEMVIIDSVHGLDGVTIQAEAGSELRSRLMELMRHTETKFAIIKNRTDHQDAVKFAFNTAVFHAPLPPAPVRHEETVLEFEER